MSEKIEFKCPHCGWIYQPKEGQSLVPTHDWPKPCRQVCPGSKQNPRGLHDNRPLWKDEKPEPLAAPSGEGLSATVGAKRDAEVALAEKWLEENTGFRKATEPEHGISVSDLNRRMRMRSRQLADFSLERAAALTRRVEELEKGDEWKTYTGNIHNSFTTEAPLIGKGTPYEIFFLGFAMSGEVGELLNLLKKSWRGDYSIESIKPKLRGELADVRIYLEHLSRELGIDLDEACNKKVEELRQRWPDRVAALAAAGEKQNG